MSKSELGMFHALLIWTGLDGGLADAAGAGDGVVGQALGELREDVALARGERGARITQPGHEAVGDRGETAGPPWSAAGIG